MQRPIRTNGTQIPVPIEWVRKHMNLTQKELYDLLQQMGVECSLSTLSHVETGKRDFSAEMARNVGTAISRIIAQREQS